MKLGQMIEGGKSFVLDGGFRMGYLASHGFYHNMSDEEFIKRRYRKTFKKEIDLENPKTLNEKLNWLKLYNRNPDFTEMVDKYEAKNYVASIIGEKYIIPTYGVWERFEDIDFDKLPNQFVLKCTHDSGGVVVCKDKKTFDKVAARKTINKRLKRNCYWGCREWPYKNVKPRIIAEKYMDQIGNPDSVEYKTTCFNGEVAFVTFCRGVAHVELDRRTNDHFDKNFEPVDFYAFYKNSNIKWEKPEKYDELIEICEKLSQNIPYLRVDCYIIDNQIYFGELTFYTWGGFIEFVPEKWDMIFGEKVKINLNERKE